jgi:predicted short-subunit dehydrogenase-like oxidoreductase (DUF2520 family)
MQRFTIIGSGNVASWFAWLIKQNGGEIVQVYNRNMLHAELLASRYEAQPVNRLEQLNKESDLYIFAVTDDAYSTIVKNLPFVLPCAVHSAGSVSQDIFKGYAQHYGVLYPYQSISKGMEFEKLSVPLCIEGNCKESEAKLIKFAQKCQIQYWFFQEEQRAILHLAATFASNFTNALYNIAFDLLHAKGISENVLFPLLNNTLKKIKEVHPDKVQTGPAVRRDKQTMEKHLTMIQDQELKVLYQLFSTYIQHRIPNAINESR